MRSFPAICCLLFAFAAFADDQPKSTPKPLRQAPPPNVQIIDGKKFFALTNVRRFTGSANDPKALNVMHHPREGPTIASRHRAPLPVYSPQQPTAGAGAPKSDSEKILSIFAPDNKTAPPASPPAPPATK